MERFRIGLQRRIGTFCSTSSICLADCLGCSCRLRISACLHRSHKTQIAVLRHKSLIKNDVLWVKRRDRHVSIPAFPFSVVLDLYIERTLKALLFYIYSNGPPSKRNSHIVLSHCIRNPMIVKLHINGHMLIMQTCPQIIIVVFCDLIF